MNKINLKKDINNKEKSKVIDTRNTSLDIVRIIAVFCVIAVHFFLNSGFYEATITGKKMLLMVIIRTGLMICVPLFLLLTGYLMRKKELSKKYYKGLMKTIAIYLLASVACLLYKSIFLKNDYSIIGAIKGILNFSLANYSWYIEMYIGLFLLIPFLNLIYNNLNSKKQKHILILTMLTLTSIPTITNIYSFVGEFGWNIIFDNTKPFDKILPFWWVSLYPITYYYIGAYLSEYKPKMNKILNIVLIAISVVLFGLHNYFYSYGRIFVLELYQSWGAIQNIIMAVLVFTFVINIDFNKCHNVIRKVISKISDCCLGAYLVSYIFDDYFYRILNNNMTEVGDKFKYFLVVVPVVFVCSIALSAVLNILYNIIVKVICYIKSKFELKYNTDNIDVTQSDK